jgi:hypothetical protein
VDPYGLDDVPVATAAPSISEADEEFIVPTRPRNAGSRPRPRKKRSSGPNPGIPFFGGLPWFMYLIILGVLLLGFPLKAVSRDLAGYSQLAGFAMMLLVMLYGVVGMVVVPFKESLYHGFTCWFLPPFLLAYLFSRWDAMKGPFLTTVAALGLAVVVGVLAPLINGGNGRIPASGRRSPAAAAGPAFSDGTTVDHSIPDLPLRGMPPPGIPEPPPGVEMPGLSSSITLVVSGLSHESGEVFGHKLGELVGRVSGGYQISSSGGGGKSTYSISMVNSMEVKAFADQITWAKVTRISGQTITIDATSMADN